MGGNGQNPLIGMQNYQEAHPIQTFLRTPQGQQALLQFGQNALAASANPNLTFGQGLIGSVGGGLQGYQQQLEQIRQREKEDELMGMRRRAEGRQETRFQQEQEERNRPPVPEEPKDFNVPMFRENVEISAPYSRFPEFAAQGWVMGEIPEEQSTTALKIAIAKAGVDPEKPVTEWTQDEINAVWALVGKMPSLFQMLLGGGLSGTTTGDSEVPQEVQILKDKYGVD